MPGPTTIDELIMVLTNDAAAHRNKAMELEAEAKRERAAFDAADSACWKAKGLRDHDAKRQKDGA